MKKIKPKSPSPLWVRLVFNFIFLSAIILLLFQVIFNYSLEGHLQVYSREREESLNRRIVSSLLEYYETIAC